MRRVGRMRSPFQALGTLWLVGMSLSSLQAQQPRTAVQGKILDQSGAPIAGARIAVTAEGRKTSLAGVADVYKRQMLYIHSK